MNKNNTPKAWMWFLRGIYGGLIIREFLPAYHMPTWLKIILAISLVTSILGLIWFSKEDKKN